MLAAISKSYLLVFLICCCSAGFSLIKEKIQLLDFRNLNSLDVVVVAPSTTTASEVVVPSPDRKMIRKVRNDADVEQKKEEDDDEEEVVVVSEQRQKVQKQQRDQQKEQSSHEEKEDPQESYSSPSAPTEETTKTTTTTMDKTTDSVAVTSSDAVGAATSSAVPPLKKRNIVLTRPTMQRQQQSKRRDITATTTVKPRPSSKAPSKSPSPPPSPTPTGVLSFPLLQRMKEKMQETATTSKKKEETKTTTVAPAATTATVSAKSDVVAPPKKLRFVLTRPPRPEQQQQQQNIQSATTATVKQQPLPSLASSSQASTIQSPLPLTTTKKKTTATIIDRLASKSAATALELPAGIKSKSKGNTATTTTTTTTTTTSSSSTATTTAAKATKAKASHPAAPAPAPPTTMTPINLDEYRLCRVLANGTTPPKLHESPLVVEGMPSALNDTVSMRVDYQCNGEPYNQFADLLEELLIQHQASAKTTQQHNSHNNNKNQWGKRKTIVPGGNRTLLILGNSHTRQLITTILCQYRDQIIVNETKVLYSMPHNMDYGVWEIHLKNNLTIYAATNCPFIYNPHWYNILERQIMKKSFVNDVDAIIVGKFNHYTESTGTKFYDNMMEYQTAFPELNIDFEHSPVPTLEDIAKVFPGPIVYVSMFAQYGNHAYRDAVQTVEDMKQSSGNVGVGGAGKGQQRSNLVAIDGRKYVRELRHIMKDKEAAIASTADSDKSSSKQLLLPVHECSMDGRYQVNTCVTNTTSYRFSNGHRCMGARGGHPDLIAWDVIESLHELLG